MRDRLRAWRGWIDQRFPPPLDVDAGGPELGRAVEPAKQKAQQAGQRSQRVLALRGGRKQVAAALVIKVKACCNDFVKNRGTHVQFWVWFTDLSRVARTPRAGLGHAHEPVLPPCCPRVARVAWDACGRQATPHAACGLHRRSVPGQ